MNYATGHAINTKQLFMNFDVSKLKLSSKKCEELVGSRHKKNVAEKVFKACINLIILDIIDNNATFVLPTKSRKSEIGMKRYDGEEFIQCRQNGKFSDVNILNSNFSGNLIEFTYLLAGVFKHKPIYLDSSNKQKITDNTNIGKNYC